MTPAVCQLISKFESPNLQFLCSLIVCIRDFAAKHATTQKSIRNLNMLLAAVRKTQEFGGLPVDKLPIEEIISLTNAYVQRWIHPHAAVYLNKETEISEIQEPPTIGIDDCGTCIIVITDANIGHFTENPAEIVAYIRSLHPQRLVIDVSQCCGGSYTLLQLLQVVFPPDVTGQTALCAGVNTYIDDPYIQIFWNSGEATRCEPNHLNCILASYYSNPIIPIDIIVSEKSASICELLALSVQGRDNARIIFVGGKMHTRGMLQYSRTLECWSGDRKFSIQLPVGAHLDFAGNSHGDFLRPLVGRDLVCQTL